MTWFIGLTGLWACWCIAFWLVWKDATNRIKSDTEPH